MDQADPTDSLLEQAQRQTKALEEIRRTLMFLSVLALFAAPFALAAFFRGA